MPSLTPLKIPIVGGINAYVSEDSLPEGQVSDGMNFLFEGGRSRTRPGLSKSVNTVLTAGGVFLWGEWFPQLFGTTVLYPPGANTGMGLVINKLGTIFQSNTPIPTTASVTALTGPSLGNLLSWPNAVVFQPGGGGASIILFSTGSGSGIYRWIPLVSGVPNAYTQLAVAPYQFLATHNAHVIGAVNMSGSSHDASIAWSASGLESNWTTLDSGNAVPSDIPDSITGLGVISNVVIILRTFGIHLATTTGVAPPQGPVYRFDPFIYWGVGCHFPGTSAFYENGCAFVGHDNVYMFNLQEPEPIGDEIKDILLPLLSVLYSSGVTGKPPYVYQGFFSSSMQLIDPIGSVLPNQVKPRLRYHLTPRATFPPGVAVNVPSGLPHFVYDLTEKKWSIHSYAFVPSCVFAGDYPILFSSSPADNAVNSVNAYAWDESVPQENGAFLVGGVHTIEDLESNFKVLRAVLKYRDFGQNSAVKVTVTCVNEDTVNSASDVQIIGTPESTLKWMRQYFNINVSGQLFQWRIDVDPGTQFETNYLSLQYGSAGKFRGLVGVGSDQNSGTSF